MAQITRILLPTAFSALSRHAADYVALVAPRFNAEVHAVHIVPPLPVMVDPGAPAAGALPVTMPVPVDDLVEQGRESLRAFVQSALPALADRVIMQTVVGGVVDELVEYARSRAIDLIIMGTHADGMLKRLVFGSTGRAVLERAPCPVLLIPIKGAPRS